MEISMNFTLKNFHMSFKNDFYIHIIFFHVV